MKKYLTHIKIKNYDYITRAFVVSVFIIGGVWGSYVPRALASVDIWATTFLASPSSDMFTYSTGSNVSSYFVGFQPSGANDGFVGYATSDNVWLDLFNHQTTGKNAIVEYNHILDATCNSSDLATCLASAGFIRVQYVCLTSNTDCVGGGGGGGITEGIQPSGTVWALSALSIIGVMIFVYFAIFWIMIFAIFWGIAHFYQVIYRFLTFTL